MFWFIVILIAITYLYIIYRSAKIKKKNKPKAKYKYQNQIDSFRHTISISSSTDRSDGIDNVFKRIPLNTYAQPSISQNTKNKIQNLYKITKTIENNLITNDQNYVIANQILKIDYKSELNENQYLVVTTIDGPILVIAGAGSGKTRTIIYRVAYLLENNIPPESILLLTFTRKAANEMLTRVESILHNNKSKKILGGTFHSFANYILRRYSSILNLSPNFTIIDTIDSEDTIDLIRHEMNFEKKSRAFPRKSRIYSIISKSRNCNTSIQSIIEKEYTGLNEFINDIEIIKSAYSEYKKANDLFDFDDLMEYLRNSLLDNDVFREKVQKSITHIMVDEFQDTNILQKEIIDLLASKNKNIMVVGDDAQSIYSFRGANFENILTFPETYPECKFVRIEKNYRSTQDLLDFTNSIIDNAKIGYKKYLFTTNTLSGKPIVKKFYSQEDEAEYIVDKILELREQNISLDNIAVLYRATFHGTYIQTELLKRNIPYVVFGGIRFIERRHVKDIIAYLRVILNPLDPVSWNRILRLIPGIGKVTAGNVIKQIHENNGLIDFNDFNKNSYANDLNDLGEIINKASDEKTNIPTKIEILKSYYTPILKNQESDYENRLLDIDVLYTLSTKYDDLEKFLSDFALDPPSNKFQDKNTPLVNESEDKPIVLSTIHSSKGLEWHSVFIPHLLDGLFPSSRSLNSIEDIEEERRLFYVASTRAKENLFMTLPAYIYTYDSILTLPSRFLMEVNKEKYKVLK